MYFVESQGADLLNEAISLRVANEAGADANILRQLLEASRHRQIVMIKTENNEPLASVSFAKVSKYTLHVLAANPKHRLTPYEYNEGKIIYVLDGFFKKSCFKKSLTILAEEFKKCRIIAYEKRGRLKVFYNSNGSFKAVNLPTTCQFSTRSPPSSSPITEEARRHRTPWTPALGRR